MPLPQTRSINPRSPVNLNSHRFRRCFFFFPLNKNLRYWYYGCARADGGVAVARALPALKNYETVNVDQAAADVTKSDVSSLKSESDNLQYRSESEANLARKKKSSTTTTFCVEIKQGIDQPPIIVCDPPGETDEKPPIPSPLPIVPSIVENYPEPIPDVVPGYLPAPTKPNQQCSLDGPSSVVHPQEIEILQPQTLPEFPQFFQFLPSFPVHPEIPSPTPFQPPQTLFGLDPNCPLASIISSLLEAISFFHLYDSKPYSRFTELYPTGESKFWEWNGYDRPAKETQFFPKSSSAELPSNVFSENPFELIYPKRGIATSLQYGKPRIPSVASIDKNQISESSYNVPFLIQCNPTIIPLTPAVYAAAVDGARERMFKTAIGTPVIRSEEPAYRVPVSGTPDIHSTQRAAPYQNHLELSPELNIYRQQPRKMEATVQHGTIAEQHVRQPTKEKTFSSASREGTADKISGFRQNGQEQLSRHQETVPNSVAIEIADAVHQGGNNRKTALSQSVENNKFSLPLNPKHQDSSSSDGYGRAAMRDEQDKIGSGISSVNQKPVNGFDSEKLPVFAQYRQNQQQREQGQREPTRNVPRVAAQEYDYSQQPPTGETFRSERVMNRMKSSLAYGNTIQ
ncbi:uncharacterized protein LOC124183140 [Neodiprion fabricii]|uniref:uncharacterized protein LOC124183140 n=1 Tax=Neodiprion fabricii TaxID=2872261 RepID=UPI001ED8F8EB|nr:uncharacterized protein LOC124183140 [Neodiprion fabricii]